MIFQFAFNEDFFVYLYRTFLIIIKVNFELCQVHVNSHKKNVSGGSVEFMCDRGDCGKMFSDQFKLAKHTDLHDNKLIRCYFCPWGAPAGESATRKVHLNQHISKAELKCDYCERTFFKMSHLKSHIQIKHEIIPGKYKCEKCGWKTHCLSYLQRHKCSKSFK